MAKRKKQKASTKITKKSRVTEALDYKDFMELLIKLEEDERWQEWATYSMCYYLALRISDVLRIRWENILEPEHLILNEKKTDNRRAIKINADLRDILKTAHQGMNKPPINTLLLSHRWRNKRKSLTQGGICRRLQKSLVRYDIPYDENIACGTHIFRKTFGKKYLENYGDTDGALVKLMGIFGHSSLKMTLKYMGITQQSYDDVFDNLEYINPNV